MTMSGALDWRSHHHWNNGRRIPCRLSKACAGPVAAAAISRWKPSPAPRAGRGLTLRVVVRRLDTYRIVRRGSVACTASVGSGSTLDGSFFGSLIPTHGDVGRQRSRTAALKMPATMPCSVLTVDGASLVDNCFTHACTSLGRMLAMGRAPSVG